MNFSNDDTEIMPGTMMAGRASFETATLRRHLPVANERDGGRMPNHSSSPEQPNMGLPEDIPEAQSDQDFMANIDPEIYRISGYPIPKNHTIFSSERVNRAAEPDNLHGDRFQSQNLLQRPIPPANNGINNALMLVPMAEDDLTDEEISADGFRKRGSIDEFTYPEINEDGERPIQAPWPLGYGAPINDKTRYLDSADDYDGSFRHDRSDAELAYTGSDSTIGTTSNGEPSREKVGKTRSSGPSARPRVKKVSLRHILPAPASNAGLPTASTGTQNLLIKGTPQNPFTVVPVIPPRERLRDPKNAKPKAHIPNDHPLHPRQIASFPHTVPPYLGQYTPTPQRMIEGVINHYRLDRGNPPVSNGVAIDHEKWIKVYNAANRRLDCWYREVNQCSKSEYKKMTEADRKSGLVRWVAIKKLMATEGPYGKSLPVDFIDDPAGH